MVESSPHIVALQDIPLLKNSPHFFQNYKCVFPPSTDVSKPRVAVYVHERQLDVVSILPLFSDRGNLMAVNLHSTEGLLDGSHTLFRMYYVYSIADAHRRLTC